MKNTSQKNFEYNPSIDSLTIYHSKADVETVAGSIVLDNFIFDISTNGTFVSLEIDNASEVFEIEPEILSQIKEASIRTSVQGNLITLFYRVTIDQKEYERALMIPKDKIALTV
ncbi:hypothetical protein CMI42_01280 [Candidatus Pacearchaeota archaeon]|jgi:uncharacterized protein YuzE|nr:hypothetical protein [Candidatus Pacearchaeota archaeon]|tara:strand:+ start:2138 stop:2479 length:342 start_codon:yes stop_codon:yes gene_type:complete